MIARKTAWVYQVTPTIDAEGVQTNSYAYSGTISCDVQPIGASPSPATLREWGIDTTSGDAKHMWFRPDETLNYMDRLVVDPPMPGTAYTAIALTLDPIAKTISRTVGSFVTDGVLAGHYVLLSGFANAQNNGYFLVKTIAALTLTLSSGTELVNGTPLKAETATANYRIHTTTAPMPQCYEIRMTEKWRTHYTAYLAPIQGVGQ